MRHIMPYFVQIPNFICCLLLKSVDWLLQHGCFI